MSDVWIANASPIIALAKAGHLRLLEQLPSELLVPESVAAEVLAGPAGDAAREAVAGGWGKRVRAESIPPDLLEWGLGRGETEVLAIARAHLPCTAILDDAVARNCAKVLAVPLIGSLGVVLRAKKRGIIERAADVLHALR